MTVHSSNFHEVNATYGVRTVTSTTHGATAGSYFGVHPVLDTTTDRIVGDDGACWFCDGEGYANCPELSCMVDGVCEDEDGNPCPTCKGKGSLSRCPQGCPKAY